MDALKEELDEDVEEAEDATVTSEAIDNSEDPIEEPASEAIPKGPSSARSPSLPILPKETKKVERKLSLDPSAFRPTTTAAQQQEKKRHSDFIRQVFRIHSNLLKLRLRDVFIVKFLHFI